MSSSDPQDEAAQHDAWQQPDDAPAPDESRPEPPSWQGYDAESTEYTLPHTYATAGYLGPDPQEGEYGAPAPYGYPPPPPAPADYTVPQQYEPPPPEVPAGAGLVPPRADALPPTPPATDTAAETPAGTPAEAPAQMPAAADQYAESGAPAAHPYESGAPAAQPYESGAPAAQPYEADPAPAPYTEPETMPRRYARTDAPPAGQPVPTQPPAPYAEAPLGTAPHAPWQQPATPEVAPRPEDLLVPDRPEIADTPARWGWRGRMNRLSAGAIKAKPKPAELLHRQAVLDIQHGFSRPMTVVVIQPKGGAGKTPTTIGIAAALGAHRGGYVVGWDDNETRGTLAVRTVNRDSQRTTVWELLGALPSFERHDARVGDLGYYVRAQGEAQFDALVSDDHPGNMAQIGDEEFHRIHAVLQRFYRVIVIDTGNNVRSPNWQAAVNAADVVVIPSTYQRDVGYSGSWVLDHLLQTGREELARHAVTVLTAADPTTDTKVRRELLRHFGTRTQDVVEIPFDEHIATGGPIHWGQLDEATRRAWTQAGAVVVGALVRRDQAQR